MTPITRMAVCLKNAGIKIESITVSDDPDIEDDEIRLGKNCHIQIGSDAEYYILCHEEGDGDEIEFVNGVPRKTPHEIVADIIRD